MSEWKYTVLEKKHAVIGQQRKAGIRNVIKVTDLHLNQFCTCIYQFELLNSVLHTNNDFQGNIQMQIPVWFTSADFMQNNVFKSFDAKLSGAHENVALRCRTSDNYVV